MNVITHLLIVFSPGLMLLSVAGWGALPHTLLYGNLDGKLAGFFECALTGILLITLCVIYINFWWALGTSPGLWTMGGGLTFCLFALWRQPAWRSQALLAIAICSVVSFWVVDMRLGYDAGLYHVPFSIWVSRGPLPLGLANLEGRLGFDSAWLLFVAAFRVEDLMGWRHMISADIFIRGLGLSWLVWKSYRETENGWSPKTKLYLTSLLVLALFWDFQSYMTTTDFAPNLCALLAWLTYCDIVFDRAKTSTSANGLQLMTLLTLSALSISFKLAMLPVLVLPVLALLTMGRTTARTALLTLRPWLAVLLLFSAGWITRNFLLSGCLAFPVSVTCTNVSWSVTADGANSMSRIIMAWARQPGPDYVNHTSLMDMSWLGDWFKRISDTTPYHVTVFSLGVAVATAFVRVARSKCPQIQAKAPLDGGWGTFLVAAAGIGLWFLAGPDFRFAWVFFAIPSTALLFWSWMSLPLHRPNLPSLKLITDFLLEKRRYAIAAALILCGSAIFLPWFRVDLPDAPAKQVLSQNGWKAWKPVTGDKCWGNIPCSPYSIASLQVTRAGKRWKFTIHQKITQPGRTPPPSSATP